MRTLVIETATEACSVALIEDGACITGEWRLMGRGHAENLVPMIAALPERGRAGRIAVSLGPGSFTGVRVGLAAARALALAWGVETVGFPTLALLAAMARQQAGPLPVTVATTGGHGEWFVESFDADGVTNGDAASLAPQASIAATSCELVAGSQAGALVSARGWGQALDILPDARAFGLLPHSALSTQAQPIYGRAPDAKVRG